MWEEKSVRSFWLIKTGHANLPLSFLPFLKVKMKLDCSDYLKEWLTYELSIRAHVADNKAFSDPFDDGSTKATADITGILHVIHH